MTAFEQAFQITVGHEGGYDTTRADSGNWTSGIVGVGHLGGTKYGVSAAAYPTVDIAALTLDDAQAIYKRDYWDRVSGDALPAPLALLVFDAAVNNGCGQAARWLQEAVDVPADGDIGGQTLAAVAGSVQAAGVTALCSEFQARRTFFMAGLSTWRTFGLGWSRRLCALPYQAMTMSS